MPQSARTFIAVPLECPPLLRQCLHQLAKEGTGLRTVSADQLHITLAFLGDTPAPLLADISHRLNQVATEVAPFASRIEGIGAFPGWHRPRVVWAGLLPVEPWCALQEKIRVQLEEAGQAIDGRRFQPHLTLGRVKGRERGLPTILANWDSQEFGQCEIDRFFFFQSILGPEGAQHLPLSEHPLRG